jgi:apolipoprotein N-acyltransferase
MANFCNALLMAFAFQLFHLSRRRFGNTIGYASLFFYWVSFEFIHSNWDLSWPWLCFGNGFAAYADLVQWYEYTGTFGGTVWVLGANLLMFKFLTSTAPTKRKYIISFLQLVIVPMIISYTIRTLYVQKSHPVELVAVQPNIDPYNEKFGGMSSDDQLRKILRISATLVTPKTRLIVCPETALPDGIWEHQLNHHQQIELIRKFIEPYPGIRFLTGASTYKNYGPNDKPSPTARKFPDTQDYFDAYNTALQINSGDSVQIHHKSKLVPGVEKMPYPALFGFLNDYSIDLGGTSGSLGTQDHPSVFTGDSIIAAPVVCYESIYGDYVGEYVRQGANLICIMTNDGWWDNTPGYRQHCQYARLRAIEHRRSIVRSANTGISCFVDQKGDIQQPTKWWEEAVIRQNVDLNNDLTFYSSHGDYIGRVAVLMSLLMFFLTLVNRFRKKVRPIT